MPTLRNRCEDIPLLVETFLDECSEQNQTKKLTREALDLLCGYNWPGNVRELKNLVERLTIMVEDDTIDVSDIPAPYNREASGGGEPLEEQFFLISSLKDAKKAFEKEFIKRKLFHHNENITKTAEAIGVERSYLHKKLENLNSRSSRNSDKI